MGGGQQNGWYEALTTDTNVLLMGNGCGSRVGSMFSLVLGGSR